MQTSAAGNRLIRRFILDYQSMKEDLVRYRIQRAESVVNYCIKAKLTQNEFDALVCHAFFMPVMFDFTESKIAKLINAGDKDSAVEEMEREIPDSERVHRRAAEVEMFLGRMHHD
jgi:GH24 family phage-related lysozyme (muramidase)